MSRIKEPDPQRVADVLLVSAAIFFIVALNLWAIERDERLFDAYNRVCATLPQPHPDCRMAR